MALGRLRIMLASCSASGWVCAIAPTICRSARPTAALINPCWVDCSPSACAAKPDRRLIRPSGGHCSRTYWRASAKACAFTPPMLASLFAAASDTAMKWEKPSAESLANHKLRAVISSSSWRAGWALSSKKEGSCTTSSLSKGSSLCNTFCTGGNRRPSLVMWLIMRCKVRI